MFLDYRMPELIIAAAVFMVAVAIGRWLKLV
jgi:hypothetical protein